MTNEFWLQSNNGKKISIDNLKELKRSDISNSPELIKLFDFFNTNKSSGSEDFLDKQELVSLFNALSKAAKSKIEDSIFDEEEADEYINAAQDVEGRTLLKNLGVKAKDLFNFLGVLITNSEVEEPDIEELQNISGDVSDGRIQELNYIDDNGYKYSDKYKNNRIISRTVTNTDEQNNETVTTFIYENNKVVKQVKAVNGEIVAAVSYDYSSDPENPTTVSVFKNENGIIEQIMTPEKCVMTLYDAKDLESFDKANSKKLQHFVLTDEGQHIAEYDGNGNTFIIVQNGETPQLIAQRFGIKLSDLLKVNKGISKNNVLQAGQRLVVPTELSADDSKLTCRESYSEITYKALKHEFEKVYNRIYISSLEAYTIEAEEAASNVYEFATKYLLKQGFKKTDKNFNAMVNDLANELRVLNPDAKYAEGEEIILISKTLDSEMVEQLKEVGMLPNEETRIFFARFNYLNSQQQQNVIEVLKKCKTKGITDYKEINNMILKYYPQYQLFETNEEVLQRPSDMMARKYVAHYLLDQIDAIIAMFEPIANSDQSLWTMGTGIVVELEDLANLMARFLNEQTGLGVEEGDCRATFRETLYKMRENCLLLVAFAENEEKYQDASPNDKRDYASAFDDKFQEMFIGQKIDYDALAEYLQALQEFQQASEEDRNNPNSAAYKKFEKATTTLNEKFPGFQDLAKKIEAWGKFSSFTGGLVDLAIQVAILYMSGGSSFIASSSAYMGNAARFSTGIAMERMAASRIASTSVGKFLIKDGTQFIIKENAAILTSMITSSAETAVFFQGTKILAAFEDGKITGEEVEIISDGIEGLFEFGMVGNILAGPIASKASEQIGKMLNSEKAIASTMKLAIEGEGTTLDKVLKALSENSRAVSKITEFGVNFSINTGYMAIADNLGYGDAAGNLAAMDAVSKLVVAMLGGKNGANLTPQKVKQIKTSLEGYEVKVAMYQDRKIYEVTDKTGKKYRLADEQELYLFIYNLELKTLYDVENINTGEIVGKPNMGLVDRPATPKPVYELDLDALFNATKDLPCNIQIGEINLKVVECTRLNEGGLSLVNTFGEEIILDNLNRPIEYIGTLSKFKYSYDSNTATDWSVKENYDNKNGLKIVTRKNADGTVTRFDYKNGVEIIYDDKNNIISKKEIAQFDYPTNVSESTQFYINLLDELGKCKTKEEILAIKNKYVEKGYSIDDIYFLDAIKEVTMPVFELDIDAMFAATAGSPYVVEIDNTDFEVIDCIRLNNGNLKLTTYYNEELILDNLNRPVEYTRVGVEEIKYSYKSDGQKWDVKEVFDHNHRIKYVENRNEEGMITQFDYETGYETTYDSNHNAISRKEIAQFDYPTNVLASSKFYKNIEKEMAACKTIEEVNAIKELYSSKGYTIYSYLYIDKCRDIVLNEIGKSTTIEELLKVKEKCAKYGIEHERAEYNVRITEITNIDLKSCKSIEELNSLKERYSKNGIDIPETSYNERMFEIFGTTSSDVISAINGCSTVDEINALKNKYKTLGLNIKDEFFDYYIKKLQHPVEDIEEVIKAGNNISTERFQTEGFDPNNIKYIENIPGVCREIQARLEREMGILSETQISAMVHDLSAKMQIPESEVLEVMTKLTQYGNMESLARFTDILNKKFNISKFYTEGGISTNTALNYFLNKQQIKLDGDMGNLAFVLDDAGLKYLESLDTKGRADFYNKVKNGQIILIDMEGTGLKIGENYYSYTVFDGGRNLSAMTEAVLKQVRQGQSVEEVLQGDFRQRLSKIFEDVSVGDKPINSYIETISVKGDATVESITNQIRPKFPDAEYIQTIIDEVIKNIDPIGELPESEVNMARSVIAKYYDYMGKVYSTDSLAELLKAKHAAIEEQVLLMGKTMDDVVYIYPTEEYKSFDLISLQYAKVNGIDPGSIILYKGDHIDNNLNGKVIVLLDDVVGSGGSMMQEQFSYIYLTRLLQKADFDPNINVIFAPIMSASDGSAYIQQSICSAERFGKDVLLYDQTQTKSIENFMSMLTPEEQIVFNKVIGHKGHTDNALVTGFQYMTPDNNSTLGGYFNLINLNNSTLFDANKTRSCNDCVGNKLRIYLDKRKR